MQDRSRVDAKKKTAPPHPSPRCDLEAWKISRHPSIFRVLGVNSNCLFSPYGIVISFDVKFWVNEDRQRRAKNQRQSIRNCHPNADISNDIDSGWIWIRKIIAIRLDVFVGKMRASTATALMTTETACLSLCFFSLAHTIPYLYANRMNLSFELIFLLLFVSKGNVSSPDRCGLI